MILLTLVLNMLGVRYGKTRSVTHRSRCRVRVRVKLGFKLGLGLRLGLGVLRLAVGLGFQVGLGLGLGLQNRPGKLEINIWLISRPARFPEFKEFSETG